MGNLCSTVRDLRGIANNNIILYYTNCSTFNKIKIQQLCDKNTKLLLHLNNRGILLLMQKIIEIVLNFNITDKLKFFNKYINITNSSINITSLVNCEFIDFTSNNIYVELYYSSIQSLSKLIESQCTAFGLRNTGQLNNNYSIINVNFNFIIDSILLSLYHLINRNIQEENNILNCAHCNHAGYYNVSGDLNLNTTNKSFCKLHKSINMKIINSDTIQDDNANDSSCIICMSALREIIFVPCGHILICSKCSKNTNFIKCCLCNKKIDNIYKLYF